MERDVGAIERHQQFGLVGAQPGEQAVEGGKGGSAFEDVIETDAQGGLTRSRRVAAIGLEIAIEPPEL
jgi:hypothetical protein